MTLDRLDESLESVDNLDISMEVNNQIRFIYIIEAKKFTR